MINKELTWDNIVKLANESKTTTSHIMLLLGMYIKEPKILK